MNQYPSVWDALENTPEAAENMKLRSELMIAISGYLDAQKGTQTEKAARLGLTQPRLNELLKGRIQRFSLDTLVNIAVKAGMSVDLKVKAA
jgi:predicted XRE-type DNA-binding protein